MRTPTVPPGARHLRTYAEFESYLRDFAQRRYPFLWVTGRPGTCKSESLHASVRGRSVYYCKGGQLTPARFYIDCYQHRGQPVILDDAEHFLDHKVGAKLISALADTSAAKLLCYGTTGRVLGDVPDSFYTTSPLCILSNRTTDDEAIQSRGVILYFDPTNVEIHRAVAKWFWDAEIHDWFGQHLYRLPPLDARWYLFADQDKRASRDWRQIILATHTQDQASCLVQDLETDNAYPTREDRARRFEELMGGMRGASRSSYFRLRRRLEEEDRLIVQTVSPILLRRTKPPGTPSFLELDSLAGSLPAQPEEESAPLDLPARQGFAEPIRGHGAPQPQTPPPMILDDTMPWERPQVRDDDDEG